MTLTTRNNNRKDYNMNEEALRARAEKFIAMRETERLAEKEAMEKANAILKEHAPYNNMATSIRISPLTEAEKELEIEKFIAQEKSYMRHEAIREKEQSLRESLLDLAAQATEQLNIELMGEVVTLYVKLRNERY
jgi:hypothetical protein